jgi:epoxyqueuosine reductase QueG
LKDTAQLQGLVFTHLLSRNPEKEKEINHCSTCLSSTPIYKAEQKEKEKEKERKKEIHYQPSVNIF